MEYLVNFSSFVFCGASLRLLHGRDSRERLIIVVGFDSLGSRAMDKSSNSRLLPISGLVRPLSPSLIESFELTETLACTSSWCDRSILDLDFGYRFI